ncbi:LPS-assembly protein LptD [Lentilitoribacter sp. Alg239-R112]|uniref:LPS-assembly protein LptD n=1 Tax=Lentilitoribacter sp. Alg239-R112 TaxID=2305987 RepID=UPI0013A6953A|nr:LPS-assembly protein LptD [Lentilitoribacter sp. Alg239-R112]
MSIEYHKSMWKITSALKAGGIATLVACAAIAPAISQSLTSGDLTGPTVTEDPRLILVADELIYNRDQDLITAKGGIQLDYGEYQLVSRSIEYNQTTGRVRAIGNVELLEPNGNRIYADELDITDDFADGFVQALRVETPDNTRIAASSADRSDGEVTVFHDGVYTACKTCKTKKASRPLWQIKARKVISNGKSKTIRFERPVFEVAGVPLIRLPSFTIPTHNSKRKSGFLPPKFGYSSKLGFEARVPYYFALAPNMDATVTASGFSKTGFMTEVEFRQKFRNGQYTLKLAGAHQGNPRQFDTVAGRATTDGAETQRGFIASKGEFQINPKWKFGWNGMFQTDQNFANTYTIDGYSSTRQTSQAYLTGLGTTSYFDLHAYKFDIQSDTIGDISEKQQAIVHPVIDYTRIFSDGITGGDLKLTHNSQFLSRDQQKVVSGRTEGLDGSNGRTTTEIEWKKQIITESGLVFTPLLAARGDYNSFDVNTAPAGLASGTSATRGMVTAGLEAKYPLLVSAGSSSHVIEPIAQIFARNDERLSGGLPNEDAQSFVFDASNLFERDKFSGFDRIEGGTRANIGIRYAGSFSNGFTTSAIFGQSFHLGGKNSFAQSDLTGAGADSGLETDRSDYVGAFTLDSGKGISLTASGRFDKDNFDVNRSSLSANFSTDRLQTSLSHSRIKAQTGYGSSTDREEISGSASLKLTDHWRVFGNTTYDLDASNFTTSRAGIKYDCDCYSFQSTYEHKHATATSKAEWSVGFKMNFRTLGSVEAPSISIK